MGILILEARALVYGIVQKLLSGYSGTRWLVLCDTLSVVCAFSRRRAINYVLLAQIRNIAGICLSYGINITFRWIPSEFNYSDNPSRVHGEN